MRRVIFFLGSIFIGLVAVLFFNLLRFESKQRAGNTLSVPKFNRDSAVSRFAASLTFKTTSLNAFVGNTEEMVRMHRYLEGAFPLVHTSLTREYTAQASVLYHWKGIDSTLKPVLLMGHIDVVPVIPGTDTKWSHNPFGGEIDEGFVWGRGAIDDKATVMGVLEAIEALLAQGFTPKRSIYLAFGHDEEVGGMRGAKPISDAFRSSGIEFEMVLDEGGAVMEGAIDGLGAPVALIGIAEKGYLSVELTAEAAGGHSSMPPKESAIGDVAEAIQKLAQHPMPPALGRVNREFFNYLGPEMPLFEKLALSNLWLFEPVVTRLLSQSPQSNATIRTTSAPTMIEAGVKDNVLPVSAKVVVNFRIHPENSKEEVFKHIQATIQNPKITVAPYDGSGSVEPSSISRTDSDAFTALHDAIRGHFPGSVVAPYLVVGGTDAKHYSGMSPDIYRFSPFKIHKSEMSRVHGIDERMSIESYLKGIEFYADLIQRLAK